MLKINNIKSFQIFQILKYLGQMFISIILAKSGLAKVEIGQFEYFNFIASAFSFFWINGIMQTLLSLYPNASQIQKKRFFFNTSLYILVFSLASLILIGLYFNFTNAVISNSQINILLVYAFINPLGFLIEHILLLMKRLRALVIFGIFTFFVPISLILSSLFIGSDINFAMFGLLIWAVFKLITLTALVGKNSDIRIDILLIKNLSQQAFPLIGSMLVAGSAAYIDGYIISQNYSAEIFAMFRYGAKEFPVFIIIASAFSASMIPEIGKSNNLHNALRTIKTNARNMMLYMFPAAIVLMLISKYLYVLVFNYEFEQSHTIFNIYLLLLSSRLIFTNSILIGLKQNKILFIVSIAELMVNVVSSLILLQYLGFKGVAYGTIIAYFFEKLALVTVIYRKNKIKISEYLPIGMLAVFSFLLFSCYFLISVVN